MNRKKSREILVGIISVVLAFMITLQIRTMASKSSAASQTFVNNQLRDRLLEWEERYQVMAKRLEESTKQLENARASVTNYDGTASEKTQQLKEKNMLLGLTDVTGEGVIITVRDGKTTNVATDNVSTLIVHDSDLRDIVSELSNAGAEAISINDQRIVYTSAIVCAGNIISINGEKISSPFVIKAIGNQERLYAIDRPGGFLEYLRLGPTVDIRKSANISIKKYTGALTQRVIEE